MKSLDIRYAGGCRDHAPPPPSKAQAGIVLLDPSGRIVVASEQAARLLGVDGPETLVGRTSLFEEGMAIRFDGSEFPSDEQPAAITLSTGRAHPDIVLGLRRPGAKTVWFHVRAEPLMPVGSSVPYMVVSRFSTIWSGSDESTWRTRGRSARGGGDGRTTPV